jgi:hypothetical protein
MDARRLRGRWAAVVATAIVLVAGSVPAALSEDTSGKCRIIGGSASLLADQRLPDGTFGFRGVITILTRACGDGPKGVSGSFMPIAGSPLSCSPTPTPRIDEGVCGFSPVPGFAPAGTPVIVTATAYTSGVANEHLRDDDTLKEFQDARIQPGAEERSSQCVMMVPEDGGRFGCSLF